MIQDFELVKTAFWLELRKMAGVFLRRALPGAAVGALAGAATASPEMGESRMEKALHYGLGGAALTAGAGKLMEHQALKGGRRQLLSQYKGGLKKLRGLSPAEAGMAKEQLKANVRGAGARFESTVQQTPFYGV